MSASLSSALCTLLLMQLLLALPSAQGVLDSAQQQHQRHLDARASTWRTSPEAKLLQDCINQNQPPVESTTWEAAMRDEPSSIRVAATLWSSKPPAAQLTVVTQLSYDRLPQLMAQCASWQGPISAAVYVPIAPRPSLPVQLLRAPFTNQSVAVSGGVVSAPLHLAARAASAAAAAYQLPLASAESSDELAALVAEAVRVHRAAEGTLPCQLDLLLVYERYTQARTTMLYPVNVLRNYARLQARTPLVGLLDVDMLISSTLFQELQLPGRLKAYQQQVSNKTVFVLPAFIVAEGGRPLPTLMRPGRRTSLASVADRLVSANKSELFRSFRVKDLVRFDPLGSGHLATDYSRWFRSRKAYAVKYAKRYEPWVLADREAVPWHDSRFRGYGQNKIIHIEHLNATSHRFVVHSQAFLLHRHHATSRVKQQHANDFHFRRRSAFFANTVYGHTKQLGVAARRQMQNGTYEPVLDPATLACRQQLPWWSHNETSMPN